MSDPEHARLLCRLARDNLAVMETLEPLPAISPAILGFHAQQAVEKALKAWLSFRGQEYPRIHHLKNLFDLVEQQDPSGVLPFRALQRLTPFAVQFRYDDLDPADVTDDFREVIDQIANLIGHVERLVNSMPEKGDALR
jgi:HEPN domain-containing protein